MNSPPIAEFLGKIKERYEGSGHPILYKIVKIPARYGGSESVMCDTEIVWKYEDLCVKMFDLDVFGWEIFEWVVSPSLQNLYIGGIFNVVTIRMTRTI